jgi:hypothetical protein
LKNLLSHRYIIVFIIPLILPHTQPNSSNKYNKHNNIATMWEQIFCIFLHILWQFINLLSHCRYIIMFIILLILPHTQPNSSNKYSLRSSVSSKYRKPFSLCSSKSSFNSKISLIINIMNHHHNINLYFIVSDKQVFQKL